MIQLSAKHLEMVKRILSSSLNTQKVYVFGSRARNEAKAFSDLDLCIDGDELSFSSVSALKDAFSESDLPYFVDLVQKTRMSKGFYALVKGDFIELAL